MAPTIHDLDDLDRARCSISVPPSVVTYPPGATFGPRRLRDFELVWLLSGRADWRDLDGPEPVALEPGTLLLARPGMRDRIRWSATEPTVHGYVHFDLDPRPDTAAWPLTRQHALAPSPVPALLDYLVWLAGSPRTASTERTTAAVLATVLRTFVSGPLPDAAASTEPAPLRVALDHVRDVWSRRVRAVPVGELAAVAGVSAEHLVRLCRRHYGRGLASALELVRLELAHELLTGTNLSITAVAAGGGFRDPLYFSKRFRTHYGVSPRAYRQGAIRRSPLDAAGLRPLAARIRPVRPR